MRTRFTRHASSWLALAALALLCTIIDSAAAEMQPYEARVIVARAQVRSGPGENFYPTDTLAAGETVEVYREEPGGWLAIRPPRESFSWVFGRHVNLGADGLAEIDKADVDSRIGSRFGGQRNAVQVRLRKGETIQILAEEREGNETWYKIAPPAGEFRWIHAMHVERLGPLRIPPIVEEAEVITASAIEESDGESATAETADVLAPPATETPSESDSPVEGDAWRASTHRQPPASSEPQAAGKQNPTSPPPAPPQPVELSRQLTEIELRLSRMVASPPHLWNTEQLERDTESLLAGAQTPADREAVRSTLAKLEQFAATARRTQQGGLAGAPPAPAAPDPRIVPIPAAAPDGSGYDAVGILRPVVSKRPGAPQFALVDDRGQVVSFVTPTPDMNLQPYVGRRIAVTGTRGFIAEFQRAHVMAGRVTPMAERMVR